MYNAELKSRFVKDYTKSINTANVATTVFEAFEPYETSWNADLCTRDREELQPAIDEILALRSRSQWMSLTILKEYVKWCIAMKVPDACDGMLNIEAAGLAKLGGRWSQVHSIFNVFLMRSLTKRAKRQSMSPTVVIIGWLLVASKKMIHFS